jgi:hypothetical protein
MFDKTIFDSAGMPVVVIMLLILGSAFMSNPKATFFAIFSTIGVYIVYRVSLASLPMLSNILPMDYLVIAMISAVLGAGGMMLYVRLHQR